METTQIILLVIVALLGIPVGFFLKKATEEEMKPGRRWFKAISVSCAIAFLLSMIFASGDNRALLLTTFAFIFFISAVPLLKRGK